MFTHGAINFTWHQLSECTRLISTSLEGEKRCLPLWLWCTLLHPLVCQCLLSLSLLDLFLFLAESEKQKPISCFPTGSVPAGNWLALYLFIQTVGVQERDQKARDSSYCALLSRHANVLFTAFICCVLWCKETFTAAFLVLDHMFWLLTLPAGRQWWKQTATEIMGGKGSCVRPHSAWLCWMHKKSHAQLLLQCNVKDYTNSLQ